MIQIAAVKTLDGKVVGEFEIFIKTERDLSSSSKIHGIDSEKLSACGVERQEALSKFAEFIKDCNIVAHNLDFDFSILRSNLERELNIQLADLVGQRIDT
ncbi:MAG: hypothetical protein IPG99_12830 [Ignavibacteria bacterium]|nr:hypothetical protein [Ignavibacteria bacterium]